MSTSSSKESLKVHTIEIRYGANSTALPAPYNFGTAEREEMIQGRNSANQQHPSREYGSKRLYILPAMKAVYT